MTIGKTTVVVEAGDPVSEQGVRAQLRGRPGLCLHERGPAGVTVVVADEIDEVAVKQMRAADRGGGDGVVAVVARIDDAGLMRAVEAGAGAIVPRCEATPERLHQAVDAVADGRGDMPPELLGRLLDQVGTLQRTVLAERGFGPTGLSEREVDVLRLVGEGCDTSEIAGALAYSERTVKNVIHDITTRLRLKNRSHAVAYAVRHGLI